MDYNLKEAVKIFCDEDGKAKIALFGTGIRFCLVKCKGEDIPSNFLAE